MQQVSEKEFFNSINAEKRDIVTSCDYGHGDSEIKSLFKTRYDALVGKISTNGNNDRKFFLLKVGV